MSDFLDNEETLIEMLGRSLRQTDPTPSTVSEFAKALFTWRNIDAELAELAYDSIHDDVHEGVRSAGATRMASFEVEEWTIDIEHDPSNGRIVGRLSPETTFTVELQCDGALSVSGSDDRSRFEFDHVATGPISLVFRLEDGGTLKTDWIIL